MKNPRNPLVPVGLFATPESMASLEEYVSRFSGGELIAAATVMGMTWNLASAIVDRRMEEEDADK